MITNEKYRLGEGRREGTEGEGNSVKETEVREKGRMRK